MVEADVTEKLKSLKVSDKLSLCSSSVSRASSNDWSCIYVTIKLN